MSEKKRPTTANTDSIDKKTEGLPFSRRGMLIAGSLLGAGLFGYTGTVSANHETDDGDPFAQEGHDHHGEYLGELSPVEQIDANEVWANKVSTTRYADSIEDVNQYIKEAPGGGNINEKSGVKIVLKEGTFNPTADQLPINLKSGVVIEGQGSKATTIEVGGIGKPVFEFDRTGQKIRRHVAIRDLKVLGTWFDDPGSVEPGSKGVFLKNIHYWLVENCQFIGLDVGLDVPGSWTGTVSQCHIDGSARYGIRAESFDNPDPFGGMAPNNLRIVNTEVKRSKRGNPGIGIYINDARQVLLSGVDISGSASYAVLTQHVGGLAIHGCYTERNGNDLDRDGDRRNEPVQIALSPYPEHAPTEGISIRGCTLGQAPGPSTGIKLGNVSGVDISGNYLTARRNKTLVELSSRIQNVTVSSNHIYPGNNHRVIAGPLNGSSVPPRELNGGIWQTADLGSYSDIASFARDHVKKHLNNGVEVILNDDLTSAGRMIDGEDFPAGTSFRGIGTQGVTVESDNKSGQEAIRLARPSQGVETINVNVENGKAIHVNSTAEKCSVTNVICNGEIDVDGEATRVVGCDASVDATDVSTVLDLSLDTGGLNSDAGDGSSNSD